MKRVKFAVLFLSLFSGLIAATDANAHRRHRARIGVFIGAPLVAYSYHAWPRYYAPPPVYYSPPVVVQPPQYIEQTPPQSSSYWYYCRDSRAYYPYVQTCPSPWQPVAPQS